MHWTICIFLRCSAGVHYETTRVSCRSEGIGTKGIFLFGKEVVTDKKDEVCPSRASSLNIFIINLLTQEDTNFIINVV